MADFSQRYASLGGGGEKSATSDEHAKWVSQFELAMGRAYEMEFEKLAHIKDLLLCLTE